jgi:CRISPR-associated protein Csx17
MNQATITRHVLAGLRPEPLASYLAGLGLIRVLAEQADPAATAAWTEGGLAIATTVTDISDWLAGRYVPTPVLSPWNNGSGFGAKDKEPKRTLQAVETHHSPRLAPLRDAIGVARTIIIEGRARGWLTDGAKGGDKGRVVQEFRNRCPDELLPWIDAAVVLAGDEPFFPPLLGTGGNDGRLDFSTNFHRRLLEVLDTSGRGAERSLGWARDLLAGTQIQPLADAAVGQFDPAAAGGPGSSVFGAADSRVNPWGYVLLVEGALLFAASAARRSEHGVGRAAIPFTVYASPDGSASGAENEASRGEIWVPVWRNAFTLAEIRQLFGEARAAWRGRPARRAVDFYAATRTLGVARGVDEFVRYGLHQRNGLAFAAVPVDRVQVRASPGVGLIGPLEDWPARLRRTDMPGAVRQAVRRFDAAHLRYIRDGNPLALRDLLAALTGLELAAGRSGRARETVTPRRDLLPARKLLPVLAVPDCESPELRVAAGLASCTTLSGADWARQPARTMRQILLPVDPPETPGGARARPRWRDTPLVAGLGLQPLTDVLAGVLEWRSRTAAGEPDQQRFRGVPTFRRGVPVPAADLHAFARGWLSDADLTGWLLAFLALDWNPQPQPAWRPAGQPIPVATLGLLHRLALGLPPRSEEDRSRNDLAGTGHRRTADAGDQRHDGELLLALNPSWAIRLAAGQIKEVHEDAAARLRQAGWQAGPVPPQLARAPAGPALIAAALVPRCRRRDADRVLCMLSAPLRDDPGDGQPHEPRSPHDGTTPAGDHLPGQQETPAITSTLD